MWKKNILAGLEFIDQKFISVEELLITLKKKFGKGDNKPTKVTELKQLEQNTHTINEFIQIFRRAARGSEYITK